MLSQLTVLSAAQAVHGCVAIGGGGLWLGTASATDATDAATCSHTADSPVSGASTATVVSPFVEPARGSIQPAPLTPLTPPPALSQLTVLSAAEAVHVCCRCQWWWLLLLSQLTVLSAAEAPHDYVAIGGGGLWLDTASAADTTDRVACSLTADGSCWRRKQCTIVVGVSGGGSSCSHSWRSCRRRKQCTVVSPSGEAAGGSTQQAPLTPTDTTACSLTADGSVGGGSSAQLLSVSVVVAPLALTADGPVGGASKAWLCRHRWKRAVARHSQRR